MRSGGRYEKTKGGKIKQIEEPTQDHPDGNAPRDAKGKRVDRTETVPAEQEARTGEARTGTAQDKEE